WAVGKNATDNKTNSSVTINGNSALDLGQEELLALILHELVHVIQNMTETIPATLKGVAIRKVESEVAAYGAIWDLIVAGDLKLRLFWQGMEALDAITTLMGYYKDFAKTLAETEENLTDGQKAAIRALRLKIK